MSGTHPPASPGPRLHQQTYWAGVVATMVVAALVGIAGVVVLDGVFGIDLVAPPDLFGTGSDLWRYAVAGAVMALVAGLVLMLLVTTTPRPTVFFSWIFGLLTLVAATVPFAVADSTSSAIATALLNLVIGLSILSLLAGVARRSRRPLP